MSSKKNARKEAEAAVIDIKEESPDEVSEPEPEPETKAKKRGAPAATAMKYVKKSKPTSSAEESNSDVVAEDAEVLNKAAVKEKRSRKKKTDKAAGSSGARKGGSIITKELQLSKDLATVVGSDKMTRSEAVKRVWAYIKENKLTDPENKQFAICDAKLEKVIGVKRFKSFVMMKYLKDHFVS